MTLALVRLAHTREGKRDGESFRGRRGDGETEEKERENPERANPEREQEMRRRMSLVKQGFESVPTYRSVTEVAFEPGTSCLMQKKNNLPIIVHQTHTTTCGKPTIGYLSPDGHGHKPVPPLPWYINKRHWDTSTRLRRLLSLMDNPPKRSRRRPLLLRIWDGAAVGCNMSTASLPCEGGARRGKMDAGYLTNAARWQ